MSQAFLNGFRASSGMDMGNVRYPQMRSADQNNTQSGNPRLAYNMPRMNSGAIASPAQQMQASPQDMFAAQQQAMQGMPQQAPMRGGMAGNPNMGGYMGVAPQMQGTAGMGADQMGQAMQPSKPMRVRAPNFGSQLNGVQPTGVPGFQQAQMPAQQGFQRPMQAQYRYPALASINSQGRRVYAQ